MVIDQTDTYVNKVAPTARIYLHLICRKRHLPLKLRKGKTNGVRRKTQQRIAGMLNSTVFTNVSIPGYQRYEYP